MGVARLYAGRAECSRDQVGAVIVAHKKQIAAGFNGAPSGWQHCTDGGCPRGQLSREQCPTGSSYDNCVSLHAEQNAVLAAGRDARGAAIYVTREPCATCAKVLIGAGIRDVYFPGDSGLRWATPGGLLMLALSGQSNYEGR